MCFSLAKGDNMKSISAKELKKQMEEGDVVVINVLPKAYFDKKHIPGSVNVPVDELENVIGGTVEDQAKKIVVYCANLACQASPRAARKLEALGYTQVSACFSHS